MKIGTIILNHWASKKNQSRYFIYTGTKGEYITGITCYDGKLDAVLYYKRDFEDRKVFESVGFCNGFNVIKQDLKALIDEVQE